MDGKPVSFQPATSPVAVPPPQPVPPPSPKRLPKILVLLVLLIIVLFAAGGYYAGSNNLLIQPVASPILYPSPPPLTETDPTAGWKTYSAKQYSFKYPSEWFLLNPSTEVVFGIISLSNIDMTKDSFPKNATKIDLATTLSEMNQQQLVDFLNQRLKDYEKSTFVANTVLDPSSQVIVAGKPTRKITGITTTTNANFIEYYLQVQENLVLGITVYGIDYNEKIVDQILSTFKFVEEADTSEWKTYENPDLKFSINYPDVEDELTAYEVEKGVRISFCYGETDACKLMVEKQSSTSVQTEYANAVDGPAFVSSTDLTSYAVGTHAFQNATITYVDIVYDEYYLQKGSDVYIITFPNRYVLDSETKDQILSTFKFL